MYPKEVNENMEYRLALRKLWLRRDNVGLQARSAAKALASEDILYFFNVFLWTYDPRTDMKSLPFVTWGFQDEYILAVNKNIEDAVIENGRQDVFTDKSRDMGVTWMVLGIFYWRWLFKKGEEFRVGSRKEDYVDKSGDMDSLFEKLRYFSQFMPNWMLPNGFDRKKHQPYMKIINPEMGSSVIGEATNKDFARGGRKKAVLFDEFQAWEMAEESWRSATDSTLCKIAVGTPEGLGNKFGQLKNGGEVKYKYHLMWHQHPKKTFTSTEHLEKVNSGVIKDKVNGYKVGLGNQDKAPSGCYVDQNGKIRSEWYDRDCEHRDKTDIAQNLDCDYLTTGQPVFDTLKVMEKKAQSREPLSVGELHWKVRPIFDKDGQLANENELQVEFVENYNGSVYVWEYPILTWQDGYVIPADCAEGLEQGDYNSACVRRRFPKSREEWAVFRPTVVCEVHNHEKTFEYAETLVKLAIWYGQGWLAIERNNQGLAVINEAFRFYRKLYFDDVMTKGLPEKKDRIGFTTTSYTKPIIIKGLGKAISLDNVIDPRDGFWNECLTFVNDDGKMEAHGKTKGMKCFDDRVMSAAIGEWIDSQLPPAVYIRPAEENPRWLEARQKDEQQKSLVGWVV